MWTILRGSITGSCLNVNKMIKRQMYGRVGFALLRKRVILHPCVTGITKFAAEPRKRYRHHQVNHRPPHAGTPGGSTWPPQPSRLPGSEVALIPKAVPDDAHHPGLRNLDHSLVSGTAANFAKGVLPDVRDARPQGADPLGLASSRVR